MKKILTTIIAFALSFVASAQNYDVIEPELQKILNQKSNDNISINIVLSSQADNEALNVKYDHIKDKALKRDMIINELKTYFSDNQNKVISFLQAENEVSDLKAHWLVNSINCTASRDVIYKLSEQSGISVIGYNEKVKLISDDKPQIAQQTRGLTNNITTVGADKVWAEGYTGKGIIVAVLDSGVNSEHVDLTDHLWDGGNSYPDHGWNFIDNNSNTNDNHGHGTHCAGTICGDGTSGTKTGMAPDATLMCVKVLDDKGSGTLDALVSGVEFAVENGADIMSISLGWKCPSISVSIVMRELFENVLTAGVVASVAAGNDRNEIDSYPVPRNINAPGNCPPPWLHPDQQANPGGLSAVVAVGAVNYSDVPAYFTSQGPVTWQKSAWDDYPYEYSLNIEKEWLHYDDGFLSNGIGGPDSFYWGVMFPATTLQQHGGTSLTKIAIFDVAEASAQLLIYYGGDYAPETLVHVQNCELTGSKKMIEIELNNTLPIDESENLWLVMYTEDGASYPASCSDNTGDPNGRWISLDGEIWEDIVDLGLYNTWMLRAYVTNSNTNAVTELKSITNYEYKSSSTGTLSASNLKSSSTSDSKIGLIRPDVSAPGVGIVSSAYNSNTGTLTMSGTSMATPCVAGVMALMLDKDPNLEPADICRILETTATKLEATKSNLTGSGRINADLAINEIKNNDNINENPSNYWTPDPSLYANDMSLIGLIQINGVNQNTTALEVGAFCGEELRGSRMAQYIPALDKYLVFLTIYGENDDEISFKLYDHRTQQETDLASPEPLTFTINGTIGNTEFPHILNFRDMISINAYTDPADAGDVNGNDIYLYGTTATLSTTPNPGFVFKYWTANGMVVSFDLEFSFVVTEAGEFVANYEYIQSDTLSSGWNWYSSYIEIDGKDGLRMIEEALGENGVQIKDHIEFVVYSEGGWYGSLLAVSPEKMYMIETSAPHTFNLVGNKINTEELPISIGTNWNWICYPVNDEMAVEYALATILPQTGDYIKSQTEFSQYYEGAGWLGALNTMIPGEGYMYHNASGENKTLVYPSAPSTRSTKENLTAENNYWVPNTGKYPANMSLIAVVENNGIEMSDYEVAAFVGDEIRGSARPIYIEALDRHMIFMTVYGDSNERIEFKYYDVNADAVENATSRENITFSVNAIYGSVDNAIVLTCGTLGISENNSEVLNVYPNPANVNAEISLGMTYESVEVYNAIGVKIAEYNNVDKIEGIATSGVYVIKVVRDNDVINSRIIVK